MVDKTGNSFKVPFGAGGADGSADTPQEAPAHLCGTRASKRCECTVLPSIVVACYTEEGWPYTASIEVTAAFMPSTQVGEGSRGKVNQGG